MSDDGRFQDGNQVAQTHRLTNAFARSGGADDAALTDPQRGRLAELRAELATSAGVIDALRERAARMVLICGVGRVVATGQGRAMKAA